MLTHASFTCIFHTNPMLACFVSQDDKEVKNKQNIYTYGSDLFFLVSIGAKSRQLITLMSNIPTL